MSVATRRRPTSSWDVTIDLVSVGASVAPLAEDLLDALEEHDGVVTLASGQIVIDITVAADDHLAAVSTADRLVRAAVRSAGPDRAVTVDRIEAKTAARAARDLDQPTYPEMLGVAEVAELLGVSKQRVFELRETGRLPTPIAELRAGPVWPRPAIERFIESWERKPGRPRRASAATG